MKLEVHHIRALKDKRQLTEPNVQSADQAATAQAAGIDIIVSGWRADFPARRAAAPDTHFCFELIYGQHVNADEAKRAAFDALEAGADSICCAMDFDGIAAMARESIPVFGHAGLVPQKHRLTGMRAFGRTVQEARALMQTIRRSEDAGAFAVELEVVAEPVATAIARATPLTVMSMGSGAGCDAQYLFATDVLAETKGRIPRHARVYDEPAIAYDRLQTRRVTAMAAFKADVADGRFSGTAEIKTLTSDQAAAMAAFPADPRRLETP